MGTKVFRRGKRIKNQLILSVKTPTPYGDSFLDFGRNVAIILYAEKYTKGYYRVFEAWCI